MSLDFWQRRDNLQAKNYWETRSMGYRGLLADALSPFSPFSSVLEIGCHSGPNLWALRQRWAGVPLYGLDPSRDAAMFGAAMCALSGAKRTEPNDLSGVGYFVGSIPSCFRQYGVTPVAVEPGAVGLGDPCDLPQADVTVTCYTLAYLSPDEIGPALDEIITRSAKGVVICEPMPLNGATTSELVEHSHKVPSWRHPYSRLIYERAPRVKSCVQRRFPGPDALDGIVIVRTA